MTATAGDGLWRVDMAGSPRRIVRRGRYTTLSTRAPSGSASLASNARDPIAALRAFEDAGLRRISPDIAAEMLRVIADKAKSARVDREELWGCATRAVRASFGRHCRARPPPSSPLAAGGVAGATWALAVIAGERANSAEMEVLSDSRGGAG